MGERSVRGAASRRRATTVCPSVMRIVRAIETSYPYSAERYSCSCSCSCSAERYSCSCSYSYSAERYSCSCWNGAFGVIDEEADRQGKSQLKRIVSMLTRLIQRTDRVVDAAIEYEYRDAEYEQEWGAKPEPTHAREAAAASLIKSESHAPPRDAARSVAKFCYLARQFVSHFA